MKMLWHLPNNSLPLAILTGVLCTVISASKIPPLLGPCNATCPVTCNQRMDMCRADCEGRGLTEIPSECSTATELYMNDIVLAAHRIDDTSFANFTVLTTLNLRNNGIDEISDDSFVRTKLEHLDLSHNRLTRIQLPLFHALHNLTSVKLNDNQLRRVELGNLPKLQHLSMANNRIRVVTHQNFTGTRSLTYLDLSGNQITELVSDCLGNLSQLHEVVFSRNRITSINQNAFHFLVNLRRLKLDSNLLEGPFDNNLFSNQVKLQELHASNNRLTQLNLDMFQRLGRSLKKLKISHNLISEIPSNAFFHLKNSIEEIDLESNKIGNDSTEAFKVLIDAPHRIKILLAGNHICETYVIEFKYQYNKTIFCFPNQTKAYLQYEKPQPVPSDPPPSVMENDESNPFIVVVIISAGVLSGLLVVFVFVRVKAKLRNHNNGFTNNPGYNLPQRQHHQIHEIPMPDAPPPPVPARNPTLQYMNNETIGSGSTESYIQPSTSTANTERCSHHNLKCPHHHPLPPTPRKSSPNLHRTHNTEGGSIMITGISHGGAGTAPTIVRGLPKPKQRHWRRSLTKHLPGHMYMARRETKDGRPIPSRDEGESSYMIRSETIDGRPKADTMGTATYKSMHR